MPSLRRVARPLPRQVKVVLRAGERLLLKVASRSQTGRRKIFETYFRSNRWGDDESASGRGSNLEQTAAIRQALPTLFQELGITSVLDLPCGDGFWIRHVDHALDHYIGADVVPAAVEALRREATPGRSFACLDAISDPLPRADAILSRDFFIHLSYEHVTAALGNMKRSGATYLIASTYPAHTNVDIVTGQWRPVNLSIEPFRLGDPIHTIVEDCPAIEYADKALGVWRFDAIQLGPSSG